MASQTSAHTVPTQWPGQCVLKLLLKKYEEVYSLKNTMSAGGIFKHAEGRQEKTNK